MLCIILAILVTETRLQEVTTPSSFFTPRNFNHHAFELEQLLKNLRTPQPTKNGPILFPNDGPPPPPRPLIVTSRPLLESIARSDLNTTNNIPASSQLNLITRPGFLARVKEYRPFAYPAVTFGYNFGPTEMPYAAVVKKVRDEGVRDNRFDDYEVVILGTTWVEILYDPQTYRAQVLIRSNNILSMSYSYLSTERTVLPPIYKAISDYAQQKVLKYQKPNYDYQIQNTDYTNDYQNNDVTEDTSKDSNHGDNYQFSYAVKDKQTGDDFSHSQRSSGSGTNGEYRVRLPDGRMQIVSYTADENGYKADVRYDDEDKSNGINTYNNNEYVGRNDYVDNQNNDYSNQHNDNVNQHNGNNIQHNDNGNQYKDYTVNNNDNAENRNFKYDYTPKPSGNDYYQYTDASKDYNDDYSSEYNSNYPAHKSKFSFIDHMNYDNVVSSVRPSYEELKDLLVNKDIYRARQTNILSTETPNYDITTERVVVIGTPKPNLFTDVRNIFPVTSSPLIANPVTARSYLVSTIANLKNRINLGAKPILSDSFIERINKYLKY